MIIYVIINSQYRYVNVNYDEDNCGVYDDYIDDDNDT